MATCAIISPLFAAVDPDIVQRRTTCHVRRSATPFACSAVLSVAHRWALARRWPRRRPSTRKAARQAAAVVRRLRLLAVDPGHAAVGRRPVARVRADVAGTDGELIVRNLRAVRSSSIRAARTRRSRPTASSSSSRSCRPRRTKRRSGRGARPRRRERARARRERAGSRRRQHAAAQLAGIMTLPSGQVTTVEHVSTSACRRSRRRGSRCTAARGRRRRARRTRRPRRTRRRAAVAAAPAAGGSRQPPARRRREGARQATAAPRAKRKDTGSDLIVRNLATGQDVDDSGSHRIRVGQGRHRGSPTRCRRRRRTKDGAFARKMTDGTIVALLKGKGNYKSLTFDEAGTQLAFLSDQAEYDKHVSPYRLYYWKAGDAAATELVSATTRGMPQGMVVERSVSRRGSRRTAQRLFLGTAPPPRRRPPNGAPAPRARRSLELAGPADSADAARARAAGAQPQLSRASCTCPTSGFVQLATPDLPNVNPGADPLRAIGTSDLPYQQGNVVGHDVQRRLPRRSRRPASASRCSSTGAARATHVARRQAICSTSMSSEADWFTYRISTAPRQPHRAAAGEVLRREPRHAEPAAGARRRPAGRRTTRRCCSTTSSTSGRSGPTARARAWSPAAKAASSRSSSAIARSIPTSARSRPTSRCCSRPTTTRPRQRLLPRRLHRHGARPRRS